MHQAGELGADGAAPDDAQAGRQCLQLQDAVRSEDARIIQPGDGHLQVAGTRGQHDAIGHHAFLRGTSDPHRIGAHQSSVPFQQGHASGLEQRLH